MEIGGVIAEFNPFHNGHALLAQQARIAGVTHLVAVMSGNFVQRGDFAITEKRIRARQALENGFDLVLELPLPYATATAQRFAWGAVSILQAAGCIDRLCFGSEAGDAAALCALAAGLDDPALLARMREQLQAGLTFAKARQLAAQEMLGELGELLAHPNNILAIEYLRAAKELDWNPRLFTLPRQGAGHDSPPIAGSSIASASTLRSDPLNWATLERYMPTSGVEQLRKAHREGLYPADRDVLEKAILTQLRTRHPAELAALPDLSEGLENRLYTAIRQAGTLAELYALLETKRYTLARMRRLVLHAFLGITEQDQQTPPPYIRVLGIGERGSEILTRMGESAVLPVSTRLARLREQDAVSARFASLEERATDLYTLALPTPQPCGYDLRAGGVYTAKGQNGYAK